jgi:Skp family chaperone for outer membrane proteins
MANNMERMGAGASEGAQEWLDLMQSLARQIQRQQQNSQQMVQELMEAYTRLLNTPGTYLSGQAEQQRQSLQQTAQQWMEQAQQQQQSFQQQAQQQQQSFQQMVQDVTNTYAQLFNIPVSYAQESMQAARFPVEGYDDLTVEDIHARISNLTLEELKMVRDREESTKKRNTVLEELDRRIRSGS